MTSDVLCHIFWIAGAAVLLLWVSIPEVFSVSKVFKEKEISIESWGTYHGEVSSTPVTVAAPEPCKEPPHVAGSRMYAAGKGTNLGGRS